MDNRSDIWRGVDTIKPRFIALANTEVIGASQRGNTVLQACGPITDYVVCARERDERKIGKYTPGSL